MRSVTVDCVVSLPRLDGLGVESVLTHGFGYNAADARLFALSAAALSILGYEHHLEEPAIHL
jgi:hypothetical protein